MRTGEKAGAAGQHAMGGFDGGGKKQLENLDRTTREEERKEICSEARKRPKRTGRKNPQRIREMPTFSPFFLSAQVGKGEEKTSFKLTPWNMNGTTPVIPSRGRTLS